ncbi:redoxin domain-containing protein [Gaiella sp.]|uniref:redoxin domain-containing protein n=1 Tax=Gaiella sp. TaxID=2663207 RepID=UPI003983A91C
MLGPGDPIPGAARVWAATSMGPVSLHETLSGERLVLLCFYPFDWSTTCTNELFLLRDRLADLAAAGVRPIGISRDSPWSHAAWTSTLGVEGVSLLSDWDGEATHGFGIARELDGMANVPARSAFLIEGDTVRASWPLGSELPDIDAVIAAASSLPR